MKAGMGLRSVLMSAVLVAGLPREARAHGEQVLIFPASTVLLLMITAVALGAWGSQWRHKSMTVITLLIVHASLWFVPLSFAQVADVAGWMFIALVMLPLGAAAAVQAIAKYGGAK